MSVKTAITLTALIGAVLGLGVLGLAPAAAAGHYEGGYSAGPVKVMGKLASPKPEYCSYGLYGCWELVKKNLVDTPSMSIEKPTSYQLIPLSAESVELKVKLLPYTWPSKVDVEVMWTNLHEDLYTGEPVPHSGCVSAPTARLGKNDPEYGKVAGGTATVLGGGEQYTFTFKNVLASGYRTFVLECKIEAGPYPYGHYIRRFTSLHFAEAQWTNLKLNVQKLIHPQAANPWLEPVFVWNTADWALVFADDDPWLNAIPLSHLTPYLESKLGSYNLYRMRVGEPNIHGTWVWSGWRYFCIGGSSCGPLGGEVAKVEVPEWLGKYLIKLNELAKQDPEAKLLAMEGQALKQAPDPREAERFRRAADRFLREKERAAAATPAPSAPAVPETAAPAPAAPGQPSESPKVAAVPRPTAPQPPALAPQELRELTQRVDRALSLVRTNRALVQKGVALKQELPGLPSEEAKVKVEAYEKDVKASMAK